jgi:hypothetical protein
MNFVFQSAYLFVMIPPFRDRSKCLIPKVEEEDAQ